MIKTIALAHRRSGMPRAEYNEYWEKEHGPLAARMMPGLRRYVQNHYVDLPGRDYQGDGIVEMWYDDMESFLKSEKFIMSEEGRALREDGMKFAEMKPGGGFWVVEEHVIMDTLK